MISIEDPLIKEASTLQDLSLFAEDGSVDIHGNPPVKQKTGNWRACPFILGNECCEQLAYYGIAKNLITYFTSELHETNVSAARHVMIWQGTCYATPLIGAIIADTYLGRYWTIASFSAIYFIGMSLLTLSASVPSLKPAECIGFICPSATPAQYAVFFLGLYLIAFGTGGIKPCVSSFGADQFDDNDPIERVKKASFFNWFFFSINIGAFFSSAFLVYIQENCGWSLGFMIPTVFMGLATASFFFGTPLYRFQNPGGSPITRGCQVLVAAYHKSNLKVPEDLTLLFETQDKNIISGSKNLEHTDGYMKVSYFHFELPFGFVITIQILMGNKLIFIFCRCLDKAAVISVEDMKNGVSSNPWKLCTITQVEEVKILVRMFPIWVSGIIMSTLHSQIYTIFVQQGRSMKRIIGSFEIPPASLGMFDTASVLLCVPIYDRIIVPFVRRFTGRAKGFTDLQRMGIGHFISILSMAAAAIVELARLWIARDLGLVESGANVAMSIFWQIPQYFLMGAAEVFYYVGQLEFYYDQSPDAMKSLCSALPYLSSALGHYLSSLILTLVVYFTTMGGEDGWIPPDNINKGHLDYYFWLLVCLGSLNLPVFVYFSMKHTQKKTS